MRYYIKTYGCQMNEHDSRKIGLLLAQRGGQPVDAPSEADLILFNTCTIRDKAQQKAISEIGRTALFKRERPELVVGVCGCVAQQEGEALFDRFPHIDLLFGPDQIGQLPTLLDRVIAEREHVAATDLVDVPEDYQFLNLVPWVGPSTACAYVTIMKGCDSRCAYCIVPRVRGMEVSRPADAIVAEVAALATHGVQEVTLLGQTVNSYGNRPQPGTIPFARLLERIADETPIRRIRFTSPHPKDVDADLIAAYRDNPKLCRHIHLPAQAGSDTILRRMRRAYSRQHYLAKVERLRAACPDLAISTDLIVGFPGETADDFAATLDLIRTVGFEGLYAFSYSPRPGTESFARLPDDVPASVKEERLAELLATHSQMNRRTFEGFVGSVQEVLIEGPSKRGDRCMGRTTHNRIVHVTGAATAVGTFQSVQITRALSHSLEGECAGAM